ncbi:ankyrin repeat-containing protein [Legionella busanensis]|uniref:Ankyrin repeat-containing protein n=1 Tax=Legionella busanensis TaxID=190655 RepID=A0A378KAD9_9GAMM|nr:ankyrin repeat domain-containing protein [Legionella busanensis]STX81676.1 ankyrin repeat-containing protein [Legionella busanensis]
MALHRALLNLHNLLGYKESAGLCHGFSLRWLEATFLGEQELRRFELRMALIQVLPPDLLLAKIQQTQSKKGQSLSDEDNALLGILAFFDSLELFHSPEKYTTLFEQNLNQNDVSLISPVASSAMIEAQGHLKEIYLQPKILARDELYNYLHELAYLINNNLKDKNKPIGFLLSSYDHAISLSYIASLGWLFRDINQPLTTMTRTAIDYNLVDNIIKALNPKDSSPYVAFNTSFILTTNNITNFELKNLIPVGPSTEVLKEFTLRQGEDGITLALLAAQQNDTAFMATLVDVVDIDFLNRTTPKGQTPLYIAVENNFIQMFTILVEKGVDLNKGDASEVTPISLAVELGYISTFIFLAEKGANLNKPDIKGVTPLMAAARLRHLSVITILAEKGADFDQADKDGVTAAMIAAAIGDASVMTALIKGRADINKVTEDGTTPTFIAAKRGHVAVIEILIIENADLNKALIDNATPVFIAAQYGHVDVVKLLLASKRCDVEISFESTIDYLVKFAADESERQQNPEIGQRMHEFLKNQSSTQVKMKPYDIAKIMGHNEIANLITDHLKSINHNFHQHSLNKDHYFLASSSLFSKRKQAEELLAEECNFKTKRKGR